MDQALHGVGVRSAECPSCWVIKSADCIQKGVHDHQKRGGVGKDVLVEHAQGLVWLWCTCGARVIVGHVRISGGSGLNVGLMWLWNTAGLHGRGGAYAEPAC